MKSSDLNFGKVEKDSNFNQLGLIVEDYEGKKALTFLNDAKYIKELKNRSITAIFTTLEISEKLKDYDYALLIVENPRKEFFKLHNKLYSQNFYFKKSKNIILEKAKILEKASIADYNVVIESNETIYENTLIIACFYR